MPLNGPEALGWALATLMLSFILGVCQAVYVVNAVGGPFNLALVLSTVMWGTFLGIPTWHGIYSSYQEYRILLGRYQQLRIRVGVLVEARNLEPPRISPPSYKAHEFRDLDYQPDLDPVPWYPLSPPPYLLDLPVNQREINVHEHYVDWPQRLIGPSAYHENLVAPDLLGGRPNNLLELLPSTPDGDDEDPNRERYTEALYHEKANHWRRVAYGDHEKPFFLRTPSQNSVVPAIAMEYSWSILKRPDDYDFSSPFYDPRIHVSFHSYLVDCLPKLSPASTPHAIANFNGVDIPSFTYEDPSIHTIPAFTITNDIFFYFKGRVHPFYNFQDFAGFIPSLWVWNRHLECTFQGSWNSDKTTLECTPGYLRSRTKNGEQRRDPKVVLSLQDLKKQYLSGAEKLRVGSYGPASQQFYWIYNEKWTKVMEKICSLGPPEDSIRDVVSEHMRIVLPRTYPLPGIILNHMLDMDEQDIIFSDVADMPFINVFQLMCHKSQRYTQFILPYSIGIHGGVALRDERTTYSLHEIGYPHLLAYHYLKIWTSTTSKS
ncbi:hypothetical protein EDD16DRAFT_1520167 [Pisolithus croceorrhizus]|nr:hypothetical protein EDD16DRAFT_1520167 [Pisolithus croceorrhizus]